MAEEGATAVRVRCPVCRSDAVATVTFDRDENLRTNKPRLLALTCPLRCQVDVDDPETLLLLGLAD
jgi:hypothetical protein